MCASVVSQVVSSSSSSSAAAFLRPANEVGWCGSAAPLQYTTCSRDSAGAAWLSGARKFDGIRRCLERDLAANWLANMGEFGCDWTLCEATDTLLLAACLGLAVGQQAGELYSDWLAAGALAGWISKSGACSKEAAFESIGAVVDWIEADDELARDEADETIDDDLLDEDPLFS